MPFIPVLSVMNVGISIGPLSEYSLDRKLRNEGGEKLIAVLLLGIPKIKIIVRDVGQSDCVLAFNAINNSGSGSRSEYPRTNT